MNGRWTNCNIIVNIRGYSFVTLTSMNLSLFYTPFISVVLSMWLCKNNFSPPSLVVYSFATPPMKLKRGQQIPWGLLIANQLDQSLWCANQKQWPTVTTLFSASAHHAGPFISHRKPCWVKPAYLDFFHPIKLCRFTYWAPLEMLLHINWIYHPGNTLEICKMPWQIRGKLCFGVTYKA